MRYDKRVFIGLFMLTSGIALWLNIVVNKVMEALNSQWQPVVKPVASSILILWIFGGFWFFLYGLVSSRQPPLEY